MTDPEKRTRLSDLQNIGPRGLECRHCGCKHFHVLYTRAASHKRLMRRRECRHCGKRVTTYEKAL